MISKRSELEVLRSQLESERSSFLAHWRDIGDYVLPRRPRFSVSDVNKGERRNQKIIDSTATMAARTLRSGMMGGITSPARPWFRLTTSDPDLTEIGSVKAWLSLVSQRMTTMFLKSNLYNVLPIIYGDVGVFGTAAMYIEEDFQNGIHCYPFPIGSYCIANNSKMKVDVFYREFQMTVRQLVQKFGKLKDDGSGKPDWSVFSGHVKNAWDQGNYEQWIEVAHVIRPNPYWDPKKLESKYKKYQSCYYERGVGGSQNYTLMGTDADKFLSERGYDYFPVLAPRWEVTGEDVYGTDCPGMVAIGDVKQLQLGEKRAAQAIEKMINPPMVGPTSLRNSKASILPGDVTFVDSRDAGSSFRPAHEINFRLDALEGKQEQVRQRVSRAFYEDLFLMLANSDRREITAREIDERHEEKLLALGPVLEQLNQDLLDPLIDIAFDIMVQQDKIPQPPKELEGSDLKVEYISIMAQAQKLVGVGSVERFMGFASQLIPIYPQAVDKIDVDQAIDVYGDMLSLAQGIIRSDEDVEKRRASAAEAQAQAQQMEQVQQASVAAKNLAGADMEGDTALNRLIDQSEAGAIV